jgi:ubiquinone/menaquinone biosynthesis C-methylase UbiE
MRAMAGRLEQLSERLIWRVYHLTMRLVADHPDWQDALPAHLEPRPGERILVLGLGSAARALAWARRCPDTDFVAADPDSPAARCGRAEAERRGIGNVEIRHCGGEPLHLKAGSVDAVFSYLATEHLSRANKAALHRECLRVLRRRGRWLLACLDAPREPGEMVASILVRATYGDGSASPEGEFSDPEVTAATAPNFRRLAVFCAPRARVALFSTRRPSSAGAGSGPEKAAKRP